MEKEMIDVKEKKEELKGGLKYTYCDNICDYKSGYIGDVIMEIADNAIDIYYNDLFEWAKGNFSIIEEANEEFGTPTDIIKQIQQGQYKAYSDELYDNFDNMIKLFIYDYVFNELQINEITKDQAEEIDGANFDNNDELEDVINFIEELLNTESEDL